MIVINNGVRRYFDKNGKEIVKNSKIRFPSGYVMMVYETDTGELGVDSTNPKWIKSGRAEPCEFGIYPLTNMTTESVEVVE